MRFRCFRKFHEGFPNVSSSICVLRDSRGVLVHFSCHSRGFEREKRFRGFKGVSRRLAKGL